MISMANTCQTSMNLMKRWSLPIRWNIWWEVFLRAELHTLYVKLYRITRVELENFRTSFRCWKGTRTKSMWGIGGVSE